MIFSLLFTLHYSFIPQPILHITVIFNYIHWKANTIFVIHICFDYIIDCGENITDANSGFISSPNFPYGYPANSRCTWMVRTAPGTRIQFHFTDFSTGLGDIVQVRRVLFTLNSSFTLSLIRNIL